MLFWGVLVIYLSEGEENNGFIFDNLLNYKRKKTMSSNLEDDNSF